MADPPTNADNKPPVAEAPRDIAPKNWTAEDHLPLLSGKLLRPIADAADFRIDENAVRYPRDPTPKPSGETPFPNDDDASAAARKWINAHFGPLPRAVSLEITGIQHSSSGRDKPAFEWDHGHTIAFREVYRGIPTGGFAIIYVTGRTHFSATVQLYSYEAIPDSAKAIVGRGAGAGCVAGPAQESA